MELLFKYVQEKNNKRSVASTSKCDLNLYLDGSFLTYNGTYEFSYCKSTENRHLQFEHSFTLNIKTGDFLTTYVLKNNRKSDVSSFNTVTIHKKNNFDRLFNVIEDGMLKGERRINYWGVKYNKAIDSLCDQIIDILEPKLTTNFTKEKNYREKYTHSKVYDFIVDYHLDLKKIKGHDSVYHHIKHEYPKKKWLKENENKFLPSILDAYGIKSKYLIGMLNKHSDEKIYLSSLNYICKLFGDNYIDYIKKINWMNYCKEITPNKKIHQLKNEIEKKCMVDMINKWEKTAIKSDSFIYSMNKLLTIRDFLTEKGYDLNFKAKNDDDFENLMETWNGIKNYVNRGYKLRYSLSEEIKNDIETPIIVNGLTYQPKILLSEEDFRSEGYLMKNCMAKNFTFGGLYQYITLQIGKKRINVQFRRGHLVQSFAKANTPIPESFNDAIHILEIKMLKYIDLSLKKEKYDILK